VLLNAKFDTMNMRQLCELLDAVEQNKRIYTKELEIIKSKKVPNTIDVNLTIATLQAKPETTEVAE
jgi:ribosomal protein S17E